MDVKTILRIQGCLDFRVPVKRVNLRYEVRRKVTSQSDFTEELAAMLKDKYRGQSGIIYCLSKRDVEVRRHRYEEVSTLLLC